MAGTGPLPKDPAARQRRNKAATKATLSLVVDHDVPDMPDARHWLTPMIDLKNGTSEDRDWPQHVVDWWYDIWSSPMSNEFDDADVHGLYLACMYLTESTNPLIRTADRISYGKSYEAAVKNFGLTPMSRRSLQWEIARADEATEKNAKRKNSATPGDAGPRPVEDDDPRYSA